MQKNTDTDKNEDFATDITTTKNNYETNASLTSQLNDLKSQHITDEVKKVEDKVFVRGFFSYEHHNNLVYECKLNLTKTYFYGILEWKAKNIYDPSNKNVLNSVQNIKLIAPNIKNDGKGLHVFFSGNYFQQDIIAIPNNVINIWCYRNY